MNPIEGCEASQPTQKCLRRLAGELAAIQKVEKAAISSPAATSTSTVATATAAPSPSQSPNCFITARPDPGNILLWYFLIAGPEGTPYEGGRYLGTLRFPPDYPFKPPTVMLLTPNGRFETETAICMTNSSFHPESWSPMWNIQSIVLGLVSFMVVDEVGVGGVKESAPKRKALAKGSRRFNVESKFKTVFSKVLPEQYAVDVASLAAQAAASEKRGRSPDTRTKDGAEPPAKRQRKQPARRKQ